MKKSRARSLRFFKSAFIALPLFFIMYAVSISQAATGPQMANYCYIPPFVTDTNAPPNIMIAFDRTTNGKNAAYHGPYIPSPSNPYFGLFDSTARYTYGSDGFVKNNSCSPSASPYNCFSGDLLNYALMSSIDLTRKAFIGFAWTPMNTRAGDTWANYINNTSSLIAYGADNARNTLGNSSICGLSFAEGTYSYYFSVTNDGTGGTKASSMTIRVRNDATCPTASTGTLAASGLIKVTYNTTEDPKELIGLIQQYSDLNNDLMYDYPNAPRFGMRRWKQGSGNDKECSIIDDSQSITDSIKQQYLNAIISTTSSAPPEDNVASNLGDMMHDIVNYFRNQSITYNDNNGFTQDPYDWTKDSAPTCRKNFAVFITAGDSLIDSAPLSASCSSGTATSDFSQDTCFGFNNIAHPIRTYVVHTVSGISCNETTLKCSNKPTVSCTATNIDPCTNESKLRYAATVSGGEYISVSNPSTLKTKIEEAILNILATASSASTVATLTTQTRESSTLTQAYFYPRVENTMLKWIGHARLLWSDQNANLREDTTTDGILDIIQDQIIAFYYDAATVAYRVHTYASNAAGNIVTCSGTDKSNNAVSSIWDAYNLLQNRTPSESAAADATDQNSRKRIIKTVIGNTSGIVAAGTPFSDFETPLAATLQPYWNMASYCSNNLSRWCAANSDCNYCTNHTARVCAADPDCGYCSGNNNISCAADSDCTFNYGTCNPLSTLVCSDNSDSECTNLDDPCGIGGYCKRACTLPGKLCSIDADCSGNYGTTCTADTCVTSGVTCNADCDTNCATSVIKFVRGYDKPNPSGDQFRIRHVCTADADCPLGTCQYGLCSSSSRDITKTLKLGDIVYSTPRISPNSAISGYQTRYADDTYRQFIENTMKSRVPIVVVGANDGMVHAFKLGMLKDITPPGGDGTSSKQVAMFTDSLDGTTVPADLGSEVWSFIPYNVLPSLKWYCSESYCHIPMLDARFTIIDASTNGSTGSATGTRTATSWRRYMIGTMGIGGKSITVGSNTWSSSIFCIDITDPTTPVFMWEQVLPDRTLISGSPAVVRIGHKDTNGQWYVVVGSGPTQVLTNGSTYKTSAAGGAKVYVFDLRNGTITETDIPGAPSVAVGDMTAVDIDGDYQVDEVYFGTYGISGTSLTGQLYRLRIRDGASYRLRASWTVETVVVPGTAGRPIFAAPEIAQDEKGNVWLYFGTGLYLTLTDAKATTTDEYIYAVKETATCWQNGCGTAYSSFLDTTATVVSGTQATSLGCFCEGNMTSSANCTAPGNCSNVTCGSGESAVVLTTQGATITNFPDGCNGTYANAKDAVTCMSGVFGSPSSPGSYNGWRRTMTGHKIFSKPFVGGGLVDVTSFMPINTPCTLGGTTHLTAVNYTTGTPSVKPAILYAGGTSGAYSSATIAPTVSLGAGVPPLGESLIALSLSGDTYKVITQVSGALPGTPLSPTIQYKQGYLLWLMK